MKHVTKSRGILGSLVLVTGLILAVGCSDDDEVVIFDAPAIAVVADNTSPFQGDIVTFTITVSSEAGLQSVSLNGTEIKTYSSATLEDEFTHEVTIEDDATTGPTSFSFSVTDTQVEVLGDNFDVSITIQNGDLRGTPLLISNLQDDIPNSSIEFIEWSSFTDQWGGIQNSVVMEHPIDDPTNSANKVVRVLRNSVNEWGFVTLTLN